MPFRSKKQLRACYNNSMPGVNCDKWVKETESVCCLPEDVHLPVKCRPQRVGEKVIGKIQTGPRGGKYFTITESSGKNKAPTCIIKVYVKSGSESRVKPRTKGCGCGH